MLIGPQISPTDDALAKRLQALRAQLAAAAASSGRSEDSITLVAVSKGHGEQAVRAAAALGVRHYGESYLQEALHKCARLAELDLTWHFIGRVQANKTRPIAEHFDWVHGIDRLKVAERLAAQRPARRGPLDVCLQVNIAAEVSKAGIAPAELVPLAAAVRQLPNLRLRGLMCILPADRDAAGNRRDFAAMRGLLEQLQRADIPVDTLSMGMSSDFREAIQEGATMVRIGTALFGPREGVPDDPQEPDPAPSPPLDARLG